MHDMGRHIDGLHGKKKALTHRLDGACATGASNSKTTLGTIICWRSFESEIRPYLAPM
jgi:hypothetical protein